MTTGWNITRCPIAHNVARADSAVTILPSLIPEVRDLIHGTSGSSPYLSGLIEAAPEVVAQIFDQSPEDVTTGLIADAASLAPDQLHDGLREAKRKVALVVALADLSGHWPLEKVTQALSDFADAAVDASLRAQVAKEARRGKLPGFTEDEALENAGGLCAIAMGKMGAGELNYSSDIDLICLFDESLYADDDYQDARSALIRATRNSAQLLSDIKGGGYVFRTDLRLRPDPSVTPVAMAMEAAERYYESLGRTWERAAYIKARACAGDRNAGEGFLNRLTPFVWRRYLDFAAIEDAHDMRLRIREHKGKGRLFDLDGHDMKLGRGGIREIEFFVQTRQLIAGGRDQSLRHRGTLDGLNALVAANWVKRDVADQLTDDYRAHREVEHRLQMVADAQTHTLPNNEDGFLRLARLMGREDVDQLRNELTDRLHRVHSLTEEFFAPGRQSEVETAQDNEEIIARWMRLPAMRSERAQSSFRRISPMIFKRLEAAAQPAEAIASFESFLSGLPAGVQLFALFEANPQLVDLIVDIAGTAPALADYLGKNSAVLDSVLGGSFFDGWPGLSGLEAELTKALAQTEDYESRLGIARRMMKERHFQIGVHHLRMLIDAAEAGEQYAELAEAVLKALWPVVVEEFSRKYGTPPGRGAAVLGMGSLGAMRLNAGSDLDLIMIYDAQGVEASDGPRSLPSRTYYARLTQALVTALSAPMSDGKLYEVDMRLRPSGRQGPVATPWAGFQTYQRQEAWGWEHLALTRARTVAGNMELGKEIEAFRVELLSEVGDAERILKEVADMRARLDAASPRGSAWDVKAGRGGLREIELLAQAAVLVSGSEKRGISDQVGCLASLGWVSEEEEATLQKAVTLMWQVVAAERLLIDGPFDVSAVGSGGRAFLVAGASQSGIDALKEALEKAFDFSGGVIDRVVEAIGKAE